jgi:hypothetical protein
MNNADYAFLMRDVEAMIVSHQEEAKAFCYEKINDFFERFSMVMGKRGLVPSLNVDDPITQEDEDWMHEVLGSLTKEEMHNRNQMENMVVMVLWSKYFIRHEQPHTQDPESQALFFSLRTVIQHERPPQNKPLMDMDWRRLLANPSIIPHDNISTVDHCRRWWHNNLEREIMRLGFDLNMNDIQGDLLSGTLQVGDMRFEGVEILNEEEHFDPNSNVVHTTQRMPVERFNRQRHEPFDHMGLPNIPPPRAERERLGTPVRINNAEEMEGLFGRPSEPNRNDSY